MQSNRINGEYLGECWRKPTIKIFLMNTTDAEYYFIQFLFCSNRDLLRKDSREIYDAMFTRYEKIYNLGQAAHIDLGDINKHFINKILQRNRKNSHR